jgi:hypothetical protein
VTQMLRCDVKACRKTVEAERLPEGWQIQCLYADRNGQRTFVKLLHTCPKCSGVGLRPDDHRPDATVV